MTWKSRMAAAALTAFVTAPGATGRAAGPALELAVAGRANAHVSAAADRRFVAVTWAASLPGGATDIFAAVSRDGGLTFAAPVRVNAVPGDARVNGEQPPRIALTPRSGAPPLVTIVWTTKGAAGTRLLQGVSKDAGRTFEPSTPVPDTDAPGNRGWEAVGLGPGGRVFAAWLDHRKLAPQAGTPAGHRHAGHDAGTTPPPAAAAPQDGVALAQLSQLYVGAVDGTVPPRPVTGGVCYCCKTALVTGPGDALYVAWRHVYAGNMRDIAFSASRDGGRTFAAPVRVSEDKWQIEGCPDDGPTMAVDARGRVHVVWPSVVTERGGPVKALFHAVSADGRAFGPRSRVPTEGQAHHPQMALLADGGVLLAWDESGSGTRRVVTATGQVGADGRVTFGRRPLNEAGSYPVVAPAAPNGWLVLWTAGQPSTSTIKGARLAR